MRDDEYGAAWLARQQDWYTRDLPRPQDQGGIIWGFVGGPLDGETETMPPAMNSTVERRGYRYVAEFQSRTMRCAGRIV